MVRTLMEHDNFVFKIGRRLHRICGQVQKAVRVNITRCGLVDERDYDDHVVRIDGICFYPGVTSLVLHHRRHSIID